MRTAARLLVCVVAFAGCDSGPSQPSPASCTFALSSTSVTTGPAGGAGSISVTTASSCAWTARSDVSWVTATGGTSATGPGTFSFTVASAADASARTGTLTVANQTVSVSQQGQACSCTLLPSSRAFDAAGGTAAFDVNAAAGCGWTAAPTAAWLTVMSGATGSGSGTVTYVVAANPDAGTRTAGVTVAGSAHAVAQTGLSACIVTLDRDHDTLPVSGGSGYVDVTASSGCAWAAASDVSWMRVTDPSGGSGAGSRRVSYAVDANSGEAARTGTITIGGKAVAITQAGAKPCTYTVAPVEFSACMSGLHDVPVTVTTDTGCSWTASPAVSWLTLSSGASGYGTGRIIFNVSSNGYDPPRQGRIEVRWPAPTAGQNVRVSQAGCSYVLSAMTLSVPATGGDSAFWVIGGSNDPACDGPLQDYCVWSAESSVPWVTVLNPGPHSGYDRVWLRVAPNGTGVTRFGTVTVRDQTFRIVQAPA